MRASPEDGSAYGTPALDGDRFAAGAPEQWQCGGDIKKIPTGPCLPSSAFRDASEGTAFAVRSIAARRLCYARRVKILGVVTVVVALVGPARATEYWVASGGDDSHDGMAVGTAWATLVHAASVVGAGDTVHVEDGDYQGFYLTTSGTSGAPITFHAEGANVRITADNPTTSDGINLEGASWVVIDGFVVNDRSRAGVRTVTASHVT